LVDQPETRASGCLGGFDLTHAEKEAHKRPTASEVAQALVEIERYGTTKTPPVMDGLRKAGLETVDVDEVSNPTEIADPRTVPGFGGRPAIAVLPFENRSNDPEQTYFADGLAEDLITRLSLWRLFPVIARNSSFIYKGKAVDMKKVSADLGGVTLSKGVCAKRATRCASLRS
jgi:hypothetical protein